jgi:hypothetical protein
MEDTVITIDVEWAADAVVADTVRLLDEHGVKATFFCTHAGIDVPGHERALHPNFRRRRNTLTENVDASAMEEPEFYQYIVDETKKFCPEAIGTRAHSLFHDSDLLPVYRQAGLKYDSSIMLPLSAGISPVLRGSGILGFPSYYMDHWDLRENATDFTMSALSLGRPGMKVMIFHPNLVFMNAATFESTVESKEHYCDVDWLYDHRSEGHGARTLFIELLNHVARNGSDTPTLGELHDRWRARA